MLNYDVFFKELKCESDIKKRFGTTEIIVVVVCSIVFIIVTTLLVLFIRKRYKAKNQYETIY